MGKAESESYQIGIFERWELISWEDQEDLLVEFYFTYLKDATGEILSLYNYNNGSAGGLHPELS